MPTKQKRRLVAVISDQQAPYFDPLLHKATLNFLNNNDVSTVVVNGDLFDFPTLSKFTLREGFTADPDETLSSGLGILHDYDKAISPKALRKFVPGNHDFRWESYLWKNAARLAPHLSGVIKDYVNSSGWDYVGPQWPHSMYPITPKLGATHGWLVRKKAGMTALAHLEHLSHSVIIGHTHRQAITTHTFYEPNGDQRVLRGVEAGCMCLPDLGYSVKPDWQMGFATAWIYNDDMFDISLATWVNGTLLWEGLRYT